MARSFIFPYFGIADARKMALGGILSLFTFAWSLSQTPEYPAPPMYSVSVNPEDSSDLIIWYGISHVAPEIDYYEVLVAQPQFDHNGEIIGIVYGPLASHLTDTFFVSRNFESSSYPVAYTVRGINDLGGGNTTPGFFEEPPDSTIFLSANYDSCRSSITLEWNDYNKWRGNIDSYRVYRRTAPLTYQLMGSVPGNTLTYTLNNVAPGEVYGLFVEALHNDGIRRSNSNKVDVQTAQTESNNIVIADFATLGAHNSVDLSFTILGTPNQSQYNLIRVNSRLDTIRFDPVATSDGHITINDDISFTSEVFQYSLEGINRCGQRSVLSNPASNIVLTGSQDGNRVMLSWNPYLEWIGGIDQYFVIRTCGRSDFSTDTIGIRLNTDYTEDLTAQVNYQQPVSSLVCFQIQARELPNIYGTRGQSLSNRLCFSVTPDIHMPNAFIPNDADEANRIFEPVFSFLPEHYDLIIYNRLGARIWEGSAGWDGTSGGKLVPEGVYVYYLRVFNYSSDIVELHGSVTIVYR
jgi:hypothetical protein